MLTPYDLIRAGAPAILLIGPPTLRSSTVARSLLAALPPLGILATEWVRAERFGGTGHYDSWLRSMDDLAEPPFRAPHHTVSEAGLLGARGTVHLPACHGVAARGKCVCPTPLTAHRPGEVDLARWGILHLSDLSEFRRAAIYALGARLQRWPAGAGRPVVVATAQPCGCGFRGSAVRECKCSDESVARYEARIAMFCTALGIGPEAVITLN